MLEVDAARSLVLERATPLAPEMTALMTSALGQVLALGVAADVDSPPFDKAMMDGYAVNIADLPGGFGVLRVSGQIAAGDGKPTLLHTATAIRIFTGAPIPNGADAVVMQERTCEHSGDVEVNDKSLVKGSNILRRASEMTAGEIVVPAGTRLTPAAFGLLAAVGRTTVSAIPRPRVAIVATGDELVEPNRVPGPGQIRNSNGPMLVAQSTRAGALPRYLGIATDSEVALRSFVKEGLEIADVLVLAGGVSVGKLDFVPQVLTEFGVETHFHKVRMKPGKPLLFGTKGRTLVFGLPGNPVSALVGFELFVRPALMKLAGHAVAPPAPWRLPLTAPLQAKHDRPTYHPAKLVGERVTPLPWAGSADLRGLLTANAFILLPPGEVSLTVGDSVDVIAIDD